MRWLKQATLRLACGTRSVQEDDAGALSSHMKARLKESDRLAVEAATRLLRSRFPVERVVLFGSKVRGTDDPESDIDLLVLTSRKLSWRERGELIEALFDIQLQHAVVISTLAVAAEEWERGLCSALPIHAEIEREGVEL
jgi:uncharacterized protein